jgi:hypothetical protein
MSKVQKAKSEKFAKSKSENGKIRLRGKLGLDIEATPSSVKGRGGIGFFFQLPTLLALDLFRKIGEQISSIRNNGQ